MSQATQQPTHIGASGNICISHGRLRAESNSKNRELSINPMLATTNDPQGRINIGTNMDQCLRFMSFSVGPNRTNRAKGIPTKLGSAFHPQAELPEIRFLLRCDVTQSSQPNWIQHSRLRPENRLLNQPGSKSPQFGKAPSLSTRDVDASSFLNPVLKRKQKSKRGARWAGWPECQQGRGRIWRSRGRGRTRLGRKQALTTE